MSPRRSSSSDFVETRRPHPGGHRGCRQARSSWRSPRPCSRPDLPRSSRCGACGAGSGGGAGRLRHRLLLTSLRSSSCRSRAYELDRLLVAGVDTNSRSAAIVRSIVALCHGLGLQVVAEGAWSAPPSWTPRAGCEPLIGVQGYLLAHPVESSRGRQRSRRRRAHARAVARGGQSPAAARGGGVARVRRRHAPPHSPRISGAAPMKASRAATPISAWSVKKPSIPACGNLRISPAESP